MTADKYHIPQQLGAQATRRFHAMVKPAGSTCNLDCTYCYYLSKENLPQGPGTGRMDEETLELFIQQYIQGVTGPEVVFSWQGGEPTVRGLDFFRKVMLTIDRPKLTPEDEKKLMQAQRNNKTSE